MPAFLIPWPTRSANNTYATVTTRMGTTRRVVSREAQAWRDGVIAQVRQSRALIPTGDVQLEIYAWPADRRRRDLDNLVKPVQDAISLAWGIDDRRVKRATIICLGMCRNLPHLEVYAWSWDDTYIRDAESHRQSLRNQLGPVDMPAWWFEHPVQMKGAHP